MSDQADFFVGWDARVPPRLAGFCIAVALIFVAAMLVLALWLGRAADAGAGDIAGEATITGVLETLPYPVLRAPPDADHPAGHTTLLAGDFKYGIGEAAEKEFAGKPVEIHGALVKRGDIDMLLVSPDDGPRAAPAAAPPRDSVPLGRWRVSGEICDGKCSLGVMRPGRGLAHKACANLCVSGGVPPVFVATAPVEGAQFLLLADAAGGPAPLAALRDLMAIPVALEGEIERRGDVAVFRVDWTLARPR